MSTMSAMNTTNIIMPTSIIMKASTEAFGAS